MNPLFQLVYTSFSRTPSLLVSEVNQLIQRSAVSNRDLKISGLLLYDGNQFVQLIEGPEEMVRAVYAKIEKDSRHHTVRTFFERFVQERHFGAWRMGYRSAKKDELRKVLDVDPRQPTLMLSVMRQLVIDKTASEGDLNLTKATLLTVDDSVTNRKVISSLLKNHYCVEEAANGEEALEMASRIRPDIILLDIDMPGLSGYDVCVHLKDNPLTEEIPVIFVSALAGAANKVTGLSLGACDYVTKPFHREEIIARVGNHIERARLRRDLRDSMEQLEAQNQRLERYARCLAHDLRSPLTSIIGHASLLTLQDSLSVGATESVRYIREAGENLSETVDSLLLMAIAERGEIDMDTIKPEELAKVCVHDLEDMIRESNGSIVIKEGLQPCVGHGPWMRRIFTNLFSNGLKYGGLPPQIELSTGEVEDGKVRYIIKDNGRGLSDEQIGQLFNEFSRLSPSSAPGIGLGLVLVKALVDQMGGKIHVESSKEAGTSFIIDMPAVSEDAMVPECAAVA